MVNNKRLRWLVPFKTINDRNAMVRVYDCTGYTGEAVSLIPAASPIVVQEDNDNDILTPVRSSTGYLSVFDDMRSEMKVQMSVHDNDATYPSRVSPRILIDERTEDTAVVSFWHADTTMRIYYSFDGPASDESTLYVGQKLNLGVGQKVWCVAVNEDDFPSVQSTAEVLAPQMEEHRATEGMMPKHVGDRYVEVLVDSVIMWRGFMRPAVYSEEWTRNQVVKLPLMSNIEALSLVEMESMVPMKYATFAEYIMEAVSALGVEYTKIWVPDEFNGSNVPMSIGCARYNFFKQIDADEVDDLTDGANYDGIKYKELLENICTLWGWSLHEVGTELRFVSHRAPAGIYWLTPDEIANQSYYHIDIASRREEWGAYDYELEQSVDYDAVNHSREVIQGVGRVSVTCENKPIDDAFVKLEMNMSRWLQSDFTHYAANSESHVEHDEKMSIYQLKSLYKDRIRLHNYAMDAFNTPIEMPYVAEDILGYTGEYRFVPSTRIGIANADWYKATPEKKNYDFSFGFLLGNGTTLFVVPREYRLNHPAMELGAKIFAPMKGGALVLNPQTMINYPKSEGTPLQKIRVQVKSGNMYWGGSGWTSNAKQIDRDPITQAGYNIDTSFWLDIDRNSYTEITAGAVDHKTLEMDCNGASGYIIPLDTLGDWCADIEVKVYYDELGSSDYVLLKSMGVEYVPPLSEDARKSDKVVLRAKIDNDIDEAKNVSIPFITERGNNAGFGILLNQSSTRYKGDPVVPEKYLLDTMRLMYGRSAEKLTIKAVQDNTLLIPGALMCKDGKVYQVCACEYDYAEDNGVYTLIEIPLPPEQ